MKKIISILLTLTMTAALLAGCSSSDTNTTDISNDSDKITVIASLFPQYDFAREIAGDKAVVKLLLPPGMESHSYEPTPGDIIEIHHSDIFLYTGDEMEPWVAGIVDNIERTPIVADLSTGIELAKDEHDHGDEPCTDESHNHEDEEQDSEECTIDGHNHSAESCTIEENDHDTEACTAEDHDHDAESVLNEALMIGEHSHEYNPHIWTSPVLAMKMVENIVDAFVTADPENASYYEANGAAYLEKLHSLDHRFRDITEQADFDTIYIGSKFSLLYFMEEYGLNYVAAYDSCEEEAEPSIKRVVSMIKDMKEAGITAVYYQELIEPYIAETIAEAAGAEIYLFHSCHNVSRDDLESGVTYLSLMEQNAVNLEKGLNR